MRNNCLTIIIVNWNSNKFLEECINSIFKYEPLSLNKVIIVDNKSSDKSIEFLKEYKNNKIELIANSSNIGFASACNKGAALADKSCNYLLFLNPDTIIKKNSIDNSIKFLEEPINSEFGISGISLTDDLGVNASCFRFPTIKLLLFETLGFSRINKKFGRRMLDWNHNYIRSVDQVIGAYFLVRKNLFDLLEGFDERFFVYYEEVDFSLRAKKKGFYSIYNNEAKCFHYGGGCTEKIKAERLFLTLRSRIIYFKKHFKNYKYFLALFITLILEPFSRLIHLIYKKDIKGIVFLFKAYKKLIFNFNN